MEDMIKLTPTELQPGDPGWEPFPSSSYVIEDLRTGEIQPGNYDTLLDAVDVANAMNDRANLRWGRFPRPFIAVNEKDI